MCLAFPGTVKEIKGLSATVKYPSFSKQVLVGDKNVKVGDKVLVQMGIIVKVLSKKESKSIQNAWNSLQTS